MSRWDLINRRRLRSLKFESFTMRCTGRVRITRDMNTSICSCDQRAESRASTIRPPNSGIHDPRAVCLGSTRVRDIRDTGSGVATSIFLSQIRSVGILRPFLFRYDDRFLSPSSRGGGAQLPIPQYLAYPSIAPLSGKNMDLERSTLQRCFGSIQD